MDGQRIPGFDNPGRYIIDTEQPGQDPEYKAYRVYDPSMTTVIALRHEDWPKNPIPSGSTFEVNEHYITAVYNYEDLALLPRGQQAGDPNNPAPVQKFSWDFVGTYTRP